MKDLQILAVLILFISCTGKQNGSGNREVKIVENKIVNSEFQSIIDSADVEGAILVYDLQEDSYYSNDFDWINEGQLPASTFKIANSIIGLESGVIESDSTVFKWDGEKKWLKTWEQHLVLKDAFRFSCVHCYQDVARIIGEERMNDYLREFDYGDMKVESGNIDKFWLEGDSRITQMQQIDFLKRLYESQLPISERTEKIVKNIMFIEEKDNYKLSGKTGLSNSNSVYNGWFIGYIELENNTYLFATNLEPKGEFDFDTFVRKRMDLTFVALKQMDIIK